MAATQTIVTVRRRVREQLGDLNAAKPEFSLPAVDEAIRAVYQVLMARLPFPHVYTASDLTISAGSDQFTLTSRQYGGDVRIRLRSNGMFLTKCTVEEIDALRNGSPTPALGVPTHFALWEEAATTTLDLEARCYPGARSSEACDVYYDTIPELFQPATTDIDAVQIIMSSTATEALSMATAARLIRRASDATLEALRLSRGYAAQLDADVDVLLYRDACRSHELLAVGRVQRWVS